MADEFSYSENLASNYEEFTSMVDKFTEADTTLSPFLSGFPVEGVLLNLVLAMGAWRWPLSERGDQSWHTQFHHQNSLLI